MSQNRADLESKSSSYAGTYPCLLSPQMGAITNSNITGVTEEFSKGNEVFIIKFHRKVISI